MKKAIIIVLIIICTSIGLLGFISGFVGYFTELKENGENFPYLSSLMPLIGFGFVDFLLVLLYKKVDTNEKNI